MPDYEIPAFGTGGERLLSWMLSAKSEGEAWLTAQPTTKGWDQAALLVNGPDGSAGIADQSNLQYPKVKRIVKELVASLSSFRHEGEFKVLWDNQFYDTAHLLTQIDRSWYRRAYANDQYRAGLQYAVTLGTGYWMEEWDPNFWGPGKGDIRLTAHDPRNVTFVQMPRDNDIQKAYTVLVRKEVPINLAKRQWATVNRAFADSLVPDREAPSGWLQKGLQKVQQWMSPLLRSAGRTGQTNDAAFPVVDIYYAYTLDGSINEGYEPVKMGAFGTNWQYEVPYVGQALPTEYINPLTKNPLTRPATADDCLLFPLRRLTIFSSTGVAYDGSSAWWHGEVPLTRIWFNDLPWNGLGGGIPNDIASLETGIIALMRGMEDSAAARLDPPAITDENIVDLEWAKSFNPRKAGTRGQANLQMGEPIKYPFPPAYYDVPPFIPQFISDQEARMDYLSAARDLVAMAKANQIPSSDTLEKLMEMAGPLVQDMLGALVKPLTQLGEWRKAYYLQFYTTSRIIEMVGPEDAEQISTLKFISDKLRGQLYDPKLDQGGAVVGYATKGAFKLSAEMLGGPMGDLSASQVREKMKKLISEFFYEVTESGLNELNRMSTKLFYIQLIKALDFPISPWTMAVVCKIPNFGPPPVGTHTEMEKWVAWKRMKMELDIELAKEMQQAQEPADGLGGGAAPPKPSNGAGPGRPSSFNGPPRIEQKDGGTRSTIATS